MFDAYKKLSKEKGQYFLDTCFDSRPRMKRYHTNAAVQSPLITQKGY